MTVGDLDYLKDQPGGVEQLRKLNPGFSGEGVKELAGKNPRHASVNLVGKSASSYQALQSISETLEKRKSKWPKDFVGHRERPRARQAATAFQIPGGFGRSECGIERGDALIANESLK